MTIMYALSAVKYFTTRIVICTTVCVYYPRLFRKCGGKSIICL